LQRLPPCPRHGGQPPESRCLAPVRAGSTGSRKLRAHPCISRRARRAIATELSGTHHPHRGPIYSVRCTLLLGGLSHRRQAERR